MTRHHRHSRHDRTSGMSGVADFMSHLHELLALASMRELEAPAGRPVAPELRRTSLERRISGHIIGRAGRSGSGPTALVLCSGGSQYRCRVQPLWFRARQLRKAALVGPAQSEVEPFLV